MTISHTVLLIMRNVSDKSCRENQNTHWMFNKFFFSKNRFIYEITRKYAAETDRPWTIIWRMRTVCWITKAKDTHSEYVILILLFYSNNGYENTPQCCVTHTLLVLLYHYFDLS